MEKSIKTSSLYIATLQAISIIHTRNHWTTQGKTFYGDHLLFERIYNSALENLDAAAEKFVATFGAEVSDYDTQNDLLNKVLNKYSNLEGSPIEQSLSIEKDFIKFSDQLYELLKEENKLTLGIYDLIMSIANERETSIYLLQQVLKGEKHE